MTGKLCDLNPQDVFTYFEQLTRIPRGSGNEAEVSDFLVGFAKDNGLEYIQETCKNIIIKKPATKGYEKAPKVILQGHLDIVCAKEESLDFDFEKDPIPLVVEGDLIKTKGTTLGADNGIAVAMAMAILAKDDLKHPEISALFTVSEETGMDGAMALNSDNISGDILINIDSEEEGTALSSCAGGVNAYVFLPLKKEICRKDMEFYEISIKGLLGGHSGIEINKNRANAIKLMARVLKSIDQEMIYKLASIQGGEKMNAIAKMCNIVIAIQKEDVKKLEKVLNRMQNHFSSEFECSDPEIKIYIKSITNRSEVLNEPSKRKLMHILRLLPQGVETMSSKMTGLVESSNNVGVIETQENEIFVNNAIRSSVSSLKEEIAERIKIISNINDARCVLDADYPEWEYKIDSPIRDLMKKRYKVLTGEALAVDAIHAGLECGLLKEKVGDIDMISIGPNIYDVHTPNERLSISSTKNVYNFLCDILENIKEI
jgi:dipeptidase D